METWDKLPLNLIDELAERESYNRYHYRPIYSLHKWWARRPGVTFRLLGLACLTDENTSQDDLLRRNSSGRFEGEYLQHQGDKFNDQVVLDPFAGGGTTLVELNRLGAQTAGYELNPVAWWVTKNSIEDVNLDALDEQFNRILAEVEQDVGEYYKTVDPETGKEAEAMYYMQVQKLPCLTCGDTVRLFPHYRIQKAKKTKPAIVFCPNSECNDRIIKITETEGTGSGERCRPIADEEVCPNCGTSFDPSDGNSYRAKYTCDNGHKHDLKETLKRLNEKPKFEYFAIQYVTQGGEIKWKTPDETDYEKLNEVSVALDNLSEELPIPDQKLPKGGTRTGTGRIRNYNYETFKQLFTDRQLLTFGKLFSEALDIDQSNVSESEYEFDPESVRDFIITALSNSLEYNSILCKWHPRDGKPTDVFARKAYIPKTQPVEGNPIATGEGENLSSITRFFERVYKAKEYTKNPFEKLKENGSVNQYYIQNESVDESRLTEFKCKTSERIERDDESVDYVITDPPYYDNVKYSNLSEFFYVWLQTCLEDEYEEFKSEHVPTAREIVADETEGKSEEFFIESLANVFSECYRVLKSDGEMVFTYHHNENEAWSVILEAIIRSGFTVTGAYPVQSEMPNNPQIADLDNTEYDILIFANKEQVNEETTLDRLRQDLFFELQEMAAKERELHENLSQADLGVILRGKCMYYYSKYYPNVYSDGEEVGIEEALDTVDSVIEQVLESTVNLPASIDPITKSYAAFHQRGFEDYDQLNKHLLAKNLNVSDLEDEKLVKGPRDKKEPVTADERINYIESKLNSGSGSQQTLGNGDDEADNLLDIDKVHYLYHLYKTDQNTVEYLKEWKSSDLEDLADFMADVTGDERYERVMEMGLQQF